MEPLIGRSAEGMLETWASQAGMVVNRSLDDRAGWDFLLEVPTRAGVDKSGALDKSEPPV